MDVTRHLYFKTRDNQQCNIHIEKSNTKINHWWTWKDA